MKSVEQQENGADADHCAEDERVPSLPQVDSLDEIVDGWETVLENRELKKITKFGIFNQIRNGIRNKSYLFVS